VKGGSVEEGRGIGEEYWRERERERAQGIVGVTETDRV